MIKAEIPAFPFSVDNSIICAEAKLEKAYGMAVAP